TPDINFRVTQNCNGANEVIIDEKFWQTRWDIPTHLNVTLETSDACCIEAPRNPDGECMFFSEACDDTIDNIGGNPGAALIPLGLVNPSAGGDFADRPFAKGISISGELGYGANIDYYEFEWATSPAGPWNPMPPIAAGGFSREFWGPDIPAGPV